MRNVRNSSKPSMKWWIYTNRKNVKIKSKNCSKRWKPTTQKEREKFNYTVSDFFIPPNFQTYASWVMYTYANSERFTRCNNTIMGNALHFTVNSSCLKWICDIKATLCSLRFRFWDSTIWELFQLIAFIDIFKIRVFSWTNWACFSFSNVHNASFILRHLKHHTSTMMRFFFSFGNFRSVYIWCAFYFYHSSIVSWMLLLQSYCRSYLRIFAQKVIRSTSEILKKILCWHRQEC